MSMGCFHIFSEIKEDHILVQYQFSSCDVRLSHCSPHPSLLPLVRPPHLVDGRVSVSVLGVQHLPRLRHQPPGLTVVARGGEGQRAASATARLRGEEFSGKFSIFSIRSSYLLSSRLEC